MKSIYVKLKHFVAALLSVIMMFSMLPTSTFAAGDEYKVWSTNGNLDQYLVSDNGTNYIVYCHDVHNAAPKTSGSLGGKSSYAASGIDTQATLKKILASMYAGYPNNATGLGDKYSSTSAKGQQLATQGVIWIVADNDKTYADREELYYWDTTLFNTDYYDELYQYVNAGGGYGQGTLHVPTSTKLTQDGSVWKSEVIQATGDFDGVFRITSLPANVKIYSAANNQELTGYLTTSTQFYFVYSGTVTDTYSQNVSYSYQTYIDAYIYIPTNFSTTDLETPQRVIRLATQTNNGAIALSSQEGKGITTTGNLTIQKSVTGTGTPAANTEFTFTVKKGNDAAAGNYSVTGGTVAAIPESGEIILKASQTATLTDLEEGEYSITESTPTQANYKTTSYQVSDASAKEGLTATATVSGENAAAITFINTYELTGTVEVAGSKTWNDNNNQDGKRPTSITVNVLANGKIVDTKTVTEAEGWAWSFADLPKYDAGTEITYTVTEGAVTDYTTTVNGYDITNSYTPGKVSVNVVKSWQDNNNQDGIRPNDVTVKLLANGTDTGKTVTLNLGNNWASTFTDLDEYKAGTKIVYTIEEVSVTGYESVIAGDADAGFTVTNSHTPAIPNVPAIPSTPDVPKTGDNNNLGLWLSLVILSTIGLLGISLYNSKKRKTNR